MTTKLVAAVITTILCNNLSRQCCLTSADGEPDFGVSWNLCAMPYPSRGSQFATYLSKVSSLVIVRPYLRRKLSIHLHLVQKRQVNLSFASHANIRASIFDKSAIKRRCPSGARIAVRNLEPRGRFCRLILSDPPNLPVCAA